MQPSFRVHLDPGVDVNRAMVIVGCPGTGLVGATTARHVLESLEMRPVGGIRAEHAPPAAVVRGGRAHDPLRIHYASGVNVVQVQADRLVIIDVERQPAPAEERPLAEAIVRWAREAGCRVVVVPGGIAVDDERLDDKVWGAASSASGVETLQALGVELFDGVVGGLAAGVLTAAQTHGIDALCFLAEAAPGYPDAKAAARILRLLDQMTLAFPLGADALEAKATRIEAELRASLEMMSAGRGHTGIRRPRPEA